MDRGRQNALSHRLMFVVRIKRRVVVALWLTCRLECSAAVGPNSRRQDEPGGDSRRRRLHCVRRTGRTLLLRTGKLSIKKSTTPLETGIDIRWPLRRLARP